VIPLKGEEKVSSGSESKDESVGEEAKSRDLFMVEGGISLKRNVALGFHKGKDLKRGEFVQG